MSRSRKCEKGREIAISALTPGKITHHRVCICYTNKTVTSAGLIICALYTVSRFLTHVRRELRIALTFPRIAKCLKKIYVRTHFFT